MSSSYGPAPDTCGRTRSTIRWWRTPTGLRSDRRSQLWIALASTLILLAVAVASTSIWNYHGLSIPVPRPTTDINAVQSAPLLSSITRPTSIEWEYDAGDPISAPATSVDGTIYIASGSTVDTGAIASLTASEGSQLWRVKLNSIADYSPVVAGHMVFIGTRAGDLIAFQP